MIKDAFKPSSGKILALIIIFALITTYGFVPPLISSEICVSDCSVEIGYPFKFFFYTWGVGTQTFMDFNIFVFIIDIIVFYLALCLISLIFKIGRRENVPDSNSGGRDRSTTQ
jgi:hypothetical protein